MGVHIQERGEENERGSMSRGRSSSAGRGRSGRDTYGTVLPPLKLSTLINPHLNSPHLSYTYLSYSTLELPSD